MRLAELYGLDVLDRFRQRRTGSPVPFHWVLGPLGAAKDRIDSSDLAASQRLAHLVPGRGLLPGGVVVRAALRRGVGRGRAPRRL